MFKAVGTVIVLVDESGDVIETKIQSVHPEVGRTSVTAGAKTVKFRPVVAPAQVRSRWSLADNSQREIKN
jgi:hypothetical protein